MEFCSMLCGSLDGRGVWGSRDTCKCKAAFLHCSPETITTLLISHVLCLVAQSCPTLWDPMDCSPPGSSVHGISQARILERVAISFSRDWTQVSCISGRFFTIWATGKAPIFTQPLKKYIFIYFWHVGSLLLQGLFSSCFEQGLLFSCGAGFPLRWLLLLRSMGSRVWASLIAAHGLSSWGSWALEHRLNSRGSQA